MNFLLNNIIQRFEEVQQKCDELSKEMKSISLDPDKYKEPGPKKRRRIVFKYILFFLC